MEKRPMNLDEIGLLERIADDRAVSHASLSRWDRRCLKRLIDGNLVIRECYANGPHWLLTNAGVREVERLAA